MSFRVVQRVLSGTAEAWDPGDPDPFLALAGAQYIGTDGRDALVRNGGGEVIRVRPGWYAVRLDSRPDGPAVLLAADAVGAGDVLWSVTGRRLTATGARSCDSQAAHS